MAEEVGFEPTKGYKPLPVFKTGAFNRSATLPNLNIEKARILRDSIKYSMTCGDYLYFFLKYPPHSIFYNSLHFFRSLLTLQGEMS